VKKFFILACVSAASLCHASLITNGDFEAGNTGFTSGYSFVTSPGPTAMYPEATYAVGTNASAYHNLWQSTPAFQGNQYMIVNGSGDTSSIVYQSSITGMMAGTTYSFGAYVANLCCSAASGITGASTASLTFEINTGMGWVTLGTANANGAPGTWQSLSALYTNASATSAQIRILNSQSNAQGNDFGVDLVSFAPPPPVDPVPEPSTYALLGSGLVGLVVMARRRK
jgi:hypothetical protein